MMVNGNFSIDSLEKAEVDETSSVAALLKCIWCNSVMLLFFFPLMTSWVKSSLLSIIKARQWLFSTRLSSLLWMVKRRATRKS